MTGGAQQYSSFWPAQRSSPHKSSSQTSGRSPYEASNGGQNAGGSRGGGGVERGDDDSGSDDSDHGNNSNVSRKRRVHYSCVECHRRKQKCNRQLPCSHCVARNVPQRCRYEMSNPVAAAAAVTPSSSSLGGAKAFSTHRETPPSLTAGLSAGNAASLATAKTERRQEIEELKAMIGDGFAEVLHAVRSSGTGHASYPSSSSSFGIAPSVLGKRKGFGGDPAAAKDVEDDELVFLPSSSAVSASRGGSKLLDMLSANSAANIFDASRSIDARSSIDHTMYELSSRGLQGNGPLSQSLLTYLPSDDQIERLFTRFMEDTTSMRYPLAPESVRRCMAKIPQMRKRGFIMTDEVSSFAVAAALLGQAVLRTENHEVPAHELTAMYRQARGMLFASIKALYTSDVLGRMDKEKCLAQHFAARFLLLDRRLNEAYMCTGAAIRCAQGLGLHRVDPEASATTKEAWEVEEERLLWCALRFDERSYSIMLERPSSIDDRTCHTTPPPPSASLSLEDAEAVRLRHELATLQGRMLLLLHSGGSRGISIREVLALDEEIVAFRNNVPQGEARVASTFLQRFVIQLHTLQTRLALLRPFFLRKAPSTASAHVRLRHTACRRRCVEAACEDATMREGMVREVGSIFGHDKVPGVIRRHIRTPKWFTSLVICGAFLLTAHPDDGSGGGGSEGGEERVLMQQARQHLHTFVELAEDRQRSEGQRDATLDREMGIMRMFLEKSSEKAVARFKSEGRKWSRGGGGPMYEKDGNSSGGGGGSVYPMASTPTYTMPISSSSPSGNANDALFKPGSIHSANASVARTSSGSMNGGGGGGGGGEDLQAILDAWFQSDSQLNIVGDDGSVFDATALHTAAANTPTMVGSMKTGGGGIGGGIGGVGGPMAMQLPLSSSHHALNGQQAYPSDAPSLMANVTNGGAQNGGEFWQGFINMLSNHQSGHVY